MTIIPTMWRQERLGLTMLGASLAAIACMVLLLFGYLQENRQEQIREQGISLTRLLSSLSYEQLVSGSGRRGMLSILGNSQANPDFAYAAVVTPKGEAVVQVAAPGTIIPRVQFPEQPTSSLEEQKLRTHDERLVHEFDAPMFSQGELGGYVRVGYFLPDFGLTSKQFAFFAAMALPVFLLMPLFLFLVRREIKPLRGINHTINDVVGEKGLPQASTTGGGDLGQLMGRFNEFVNFAQKKISTLENDQADLVTSTKLLAYKRSRIESVIHSFPDAVIVLDETGIVTLVNPRIKPLLGIDAGKVIGKRVTDWCTNAEVIGMVSACDRKAMAGYTAKPVQFSPENSPEKTIVASAFPLIAPSVQNQPVGTLLVFRDGTAEHLAQQSRGDFVAHVAHELKSPLNVLAMYSEALQGTDGQSDAFRIEASNIIHDEVERLSALINNMLSITKIEMGSMGIERQRLRLGDFLKDTFDAVSRNASDKDLSLNLDIPNELNAIQADKALLSVAINNLLTNAIKYNRPGGSVTLSAEESDEFVRITITDTGIGIGPEDLEHVFDKFYRSDAENVRQCTGHGLGLSLAHEIIQLHHGELTANSKLGEGTAFIVEFSKRAGWQEQVI